MKNKIYSISNSLRLAHLFKILHRNRPIILAFHGVTNDKPGKLCNYQGKHLYLPIFTQMMEYVASNYSPVPLARIVDWLENKSTLPSNAISVTFDDGYRNVLTQAAPTLNKLNIPATVFIVTNFVFKKQMPWPDQLISAISLTKRTYLSFDWGGHTEEFSLETDEEKKLADISIRKLFKSLPEKNGTELINQIIEKLGVSVQDLESASADHLPLQPDELGELQDLNIEIGSHTSSHQIVTRCTLDKIKNELEESKKTIEEATGKTCNEFAYPNGALGDFNEISRRVLIEAGYRCAVTTVKQRASHLTDCFEIPRYLLGSNEKPMANFVAEMSGYPMFLRSIKNHLGRKRKQ